MPKKADLEEAFAAGALTLFGLGIIAARCVQVILELSTKVDPCVANLGWNCAPGSIPFVPISATFWDAWSTSPSDNILFAVSLGALWMLVVYLIVEYSKD